MEAVRSALGAAAGEGSGSLDILNPALFSGLGCALAWWAVASVNAARKRARLAKTVPSVEGGLPVLGQALNLMKAAPYEVFSEWMNKYGHIYRFQLFGRRCVVVADPGLMKHVMRTQMSTFHKDINFTYHAFLDLLGTGIVSSDGAAWRRQRHKVSSVFRLEVLSEIPAMARRATARLATKLDKIKGTGQSIEMGEELRHLTMQVISEVLMSLSPEETDQTFAKMYLPIVVEGNHRIWNPLREYCPLMPAWWRQRRNVKALNDYITGIIVARWDATRKGESTGALAAGGEGVGNDTDRDKGDVLDRVLASVGPGEWGRATIRQIRDEMKTFVLAGHETSATMLNWALFELTQNGALEEQVVAESRAVFGPGASLSGPLPSVDGLRKLELSDACLRETLRKYSVIPTLPRVNSVDCTISGDDGVDHFIPKGTTLMMHVKGVHDRMDIWPEPSSFNPRRFLDGEIKPYTFLPFIDGPRNCLGQHLSLLESKVVLSLLVRRYRFTVENKDTAWELHPWMVPIISKHGTYLTVEDRAETFVTKEA